MSFQAILWGPAILVGVVTFALGLAFLFYGWRQRDVNKICAGLSAFVMGYGVMALFRRLASEDEDPLWDTLVAVSQIMGPAKSRLETTWRYRAWHGNASLGSVWDGLKLRERLLEDAIAIGVAADEGRGAARPWPDGSTSDMASNGAPRSSASESKASLSGPTAPRKPHRL